MATPPRGFSFTVFADADTLAEVGGNHRLPEQSRTSLLNLLRQLHGEEAGPESGRWLIARVRFDGINVHFDRRFDSRPVWFTADGPTLETLSAEMSRRTPAWRPAWARLLP